MPGENSEIPEHRRFIDAATISRAAAAALVDAVQAAAAEIGFAAAVAITDGGGHLKAFERADTASFAAGSVAIDKAWTAVAFGFATQAWCDILADPETAGLGRVARLMPVAGGLPIVQGDRLLGGLGVSGSTVNTDRRAALAGLIAAGFDSPT